MSEKPPAPSNVADKFMLRLPNGMRDRIAEAAKSRKRSMNAEIVARLEESFGADAFQNEFSMFRKKSTVKNTRTGEEVEIDEIGGILKQAEKAIYQVLMKQGMIKPDEDEEPPTSNSSG
jgi:ERCC4-type nuclease